MAFDFQSTKYLKYDARTHTNRDEGLIIVPLAKAPTDPPPHYRIIRVHAPIAIRNVEIDAMKVGTPPVMPLAGNARGGDQLLSSDLETMMPMDGVSSAGRTHKAKMNLTFVEQPAGVQRARILGVDVIPTARPPFIRPIFDTIASVIAGALATIPIIGPTLYAVIYAAGFLDPIYDSASGLPTPSTPNPSMNGVINPDLTTDTYVENAIDTKPVYFTSDLIR